MNGGIAAYFGEQSTTIYPHIYNNIPGGKGMMLIRDYQNVRMFVGLHMFG